MGEAEPRYAILGPLRVDGDAFVSHAPKQRLLLTILLVRANRSVPIDTLTELLWPDGPPSRPRKAVTWHVLQLRRSLGGGDVIDWHHGGYRMRVAEDAIDARLFQALLREAGDRLRTDPTGAEALLRRALGLWRDPALSELAAVAPLRDEAERLTELRLTALERHGDAELALGRHAALIPALESRIAENPFRERFLAQLMQALHRDGRRAEALRVFAEGQARLVVGYGLDLSPAVRELKERIEADDAETGPAPPRPRQLPADIASFTGREAEVAALTAVDEADGGDTIVLSAVDGLGGVGKTALAVHAAHRLAEHYPDGQLFLDLRGYTVDAVPVPPHEALERLLRALGVDGGRIPADTDERAALLRSVTAGRRLLLVLDNAADDAQVRPLLPGGGHRVIVTSRQALPGLDEARRYSLNVLSTAAAVALFDRIAGRDGTETDRALVTAVVEACGRLPLAVRIAASLLRHRPHWTLERLSRRLADDTRRLARLRVGDRGLAATFGLSLRDMDDAQRRAFRLLTAAPMLDFGPAAAAAILAVETDEAEELLTALVDARLLENPTPDRYDFHDLVRLYGNEQATDAERVEVTARLGRWYVAHARAAWLHLSRKSPLLAGDLDPGDASVADYDAALRWFDTDLDNLMLFARRASEQPTAVWLLADALSGYFWIRHDNARWLEASRLGLAAADDRDDPAARAAMHHALGSVLRRRGDYDEALDQQGHALRLAREVADEHRVYAVMLEIAATQQITGDIDAAVDTARRAYAHVSKHERGSPFSALDILGICYQMRGELRKAAAVDRLCAYRKRRSASLSLQNSLGNLAIVYVDMGRVDDARDAAAEALRISREQGDGNGLKSNLDNMARVEIAAGHVDTAVEYATEALRVCEEIGAVNSRAYLLVTLAAARLPDNPEESRRLAEEGLAVARRLGSTAAEVESRIALAEAQLTLRDPAAARESATRALELAREQDYRLLGGRALTILAEAALAEGDAPRAARLAAEAVDVHDRTGSRPNRDRAARCLAAAAP